MLAPKILKQKHQTTCITQYNLVDLLKLKQFKMSYDISIIHNDEEVYESNYTYNVSPMLYDANGGDWKIVHGLGCEAAAEILYKILQNLTANPLKYKSMNPSNGWGDYEGCVAWVDEMLGACNTYPHGVFYIH